MEKPRGSSQSKQGSLFEIENSLKCPVCKNFYNEAVLIAACSHNVCFSCVPKKIKECPICCKPFKEEPVRNSVLDALVKTFNKTENEEAPASEEEPMCSSWINDSTESLSSQDDSTASQDEEQPGEVPCPVCLVPIPGHSINIHLDTCLLTSEKRESLRSTAKQKLKPLPKNVYRLLSTNQLQNRVREFGLESHGSRKTLLRRLQIYAMVYNTQLQSDNPFSAAEMSQEVARREKIRLDAKSEGTDDAYFGDTDSSERRSRRTTPAANVKRRSSGKRVERDETDESTDCEKISLKRRGRLRKSVQSCDFKVDVKIAGSAGKQCGHVDRGQDASAKKESRTKSLRKAKGLTEQCSVVERSPTGAQTVPQRGRSKMSLTEAVEKIETISTSESDPGANSNESCGEQETVSENEFAESEVCDLENDVMEFSRGTGGRPGARIGRVGIVEDMGLLSKSASAEAAVGNCVLGSRRGRRSLRSERSGDKELVKGGGAWVETEEKGGCLAAVRRGRSHKKLPEDSGFCGRPSALKGKGREGERKLDEAKSSRTGTEKRNVGVQAMRRNGTKLGCPVSDLEGGTLKTTKRKGEMTEGTVAYDSARVNAGVKAIRRGRSRTKLSEDLVSDFEAGSFKFARHGEMAEDTDARAVSKRQGADTNAKGATSQMNEGVPGIQKGRSRTKLSEDPVSDLEAGSFKAGSFKAGSFKSARQGETADNKGARAATSQINEGIQDIHRGKSRTKFSEDAVSDLEAGSFKFARQGEMVGDTGARAATSQINEGGQDIRRSRSRTKLSEDPMPDLEAESFKFTRQGEMVGDTGARATSQINEGGQDIRRGRSRTKLSENAASDLEAGSSKSTRRKGEIAKDLGTRTATLQVNEGTQAIRRGRSLTKFSEEPTAVGSTAKRARVNRERSNSIKDRREVVHKSGIEGSEVAEVEDRERPDSIKDQSEGAHEFWIEVSEVATEVEDSELSELDSGRESRRVTRRSLQTQSERGCADSQITLPRRKIGRSKIDSDIHTKISEFDPQGHSSPKFTSLRSRKFEPMTNGGSLEMSDVQTVKQKSGLISPLCTADVVKGQTIHSSPAHSCREIDTAEAEEVKSRRSSIPRSPGCLNSPRGKFANKQQTNSLLSRSLSSPKTETVNSRRSLRSLNIAKRRHGSQDFESITGPKRVDSLKKSHRAPRSSSLDAIGTASDSEKENKIVRRSHSLEKVLRMSASPADQRSPLSAEEVEKIRRSNSPVIQIRRLSNEETQKYLSPNFTSEGKRSRENSLGGQPKIIPVFSKENELEVSEDLGRKGRRKSSRLSADQSTRVWVDQNVKVGSNLDESEGNLRTSTRMTRSRSSHHVKDNDNFGSLQSSNRRKVSRARAGVTSGNLETGVRGSGAGAVLNMQDTESKGTVSSPELTVRAARSMEANDHSQSPDVKPSSVRKGEVACRLRRSMSPVASLFSAEVHSETLNEAEVLETKNSETCASNFGEVEMEEQNADGKDAGAQVLGREVHSETVNKAESEVLETTNYNTCASNLGGKIEIEEQNCGQKEPEAQNFGSEFPVDESQSIEKVDCGVVELNFKSDVCTTEICPVGRTDKNVGVDTGSSEKGTVDGLEELPKSPQVTRMTPSSRKRKRSASRSPVVPKGQNTPSHEQKRRKTCYSDKRLCVKERKLEEPMKNLNTSHSEDVYDFDTSGEMHSPVSLKKTKVNAERNSGRLERRNSTLPLPQINEDSQSEQEGKGLNETTESSDARDFDAFGSPLATPLESSFSRENRKKMLTPLVAGIFCNSPAFGSAACLEDEDHVDGLGYVEDSSSEAGSDDGLLGAISQRIDNFGADGEDHPDINQNIHRIDVAKLWPALSKLPAEGITNKIQRLQEEQTSVAVPSPKKIQEENIDYPPESPIIHRLGGRLFRKRTPGGQGSSASDVEKAKKRLC